MECGRAGCRAIARYRIVVVLGSGNPQDWTRAEVQTDRLVCEAHQADTGVGDVVSNSDWLTFVQVFAGQKRAAPVRTLTRLDFVDVLAMPEAKA